MFQLGYVDSEASDLGGIPYVLALFPAISGCRVWWEYVDFGWPRK